MRIDLSSTATPAPDRCFFIYDPEGAGFSYFESAEARDAAKDDIIRAYLDDGWDETVEQVVAGVLTHTCEKINVVPRPPEDQINENGLDQDGDHWEPDWAYRCDYDLVPLAAVTA